MERDLRAARFQEAIDALKSEQFHEAEALLSELELDLRANESASSEATEVLLKTIHNFAENRLDASVRSSDQMVPQAIEPVREGVSLVTCAMNRTENLLHALPSWLRHDEINEIIIVDWSSEVPVEEELKRSRISDPRIKIVHALNEPRWILSFAFNLGFRLAKYSSILKVDADIVISKNFFDRNKLQEGQFIAGDWRAAAEGQEFINGFFYVRTEDLGAIGGFNEYITTYGWDDTDLFDRLEQHGLRRVLVDVSTINHRSHDDTKRISKLERFDCAWDELMSTTKFSIQRNRYLNSLMPEWRNKFTLCHFRVLERRLRKLTVDRRREYSPLFANHSIEYDSYYYAAVALVSWRVGVRAYHVPKARFCSLLGKYKLSEITPELIEKNMESRADLKTLPPPQGYLSHNPSLIVDAQHGLGNRLRAIGSAASIAKSTGRELVILWTPDHHCEARFSDLFRYDGLVVEGVLPERLGKDAKVYNYMEAEEGAQKDALIDLDFAGDILLRGAYTFNSPYSSWENENAFLRSLRPSAFVGNLVASVKEKCDVSIHIRMIGSAGTDTASYDSAENWTAEAHQKINHWRSRSHYKYFLKRIDSLIKDDGVNKMFLAADNPEAYDIFCQMYGDKVIFIERELFDRSAEQIQYALADAYLLGSAPLLIGSTWSSFTELANRLAEDEIRVEMSGKDF